MRKRTCFPVSTLVVLALCWCGAARAQNVVINEVLASHTGTDDTEFIELFGSPGTSLEGLSLIVVESDSTDNGAIDRRIDFGATDMVGSNGFYLIGNPAGLAANYGVVPHFEIGNNFLENSSLTVALAQTSSLVGSSVTSSEVVVDTVALTDGDAADVFFFGAPVIGPDGSFFPAGARRVADGVDTDTAADWVISDFFLGPANTPTGIPLPPPTDATIMEIQGDNHLSPLAGERVRTTGVVTAVDTNGFYLQDPDGDGMTRTSDGIFVFSGASVGAGNLLEIVGTVDEDQPGPATAFNLSVTTLVASEVSLLAEESPLPDPVVIGPGGQTPPTEVIDDDDDVLYDPETDGNFEPDVDGLDFYETFEGMLVLLRATIAVSPTNRFGEIFTVVDRTEASGLSKRGTINISPDDFNPERVQVDDNFGLSPMTTPPANVGDRLSDVIGVMSFDFGNYEVRFTEPFTVSSAGLQPETTNVHPSRRRLTVASYNVLNLDPNDADGDTDVADGRFEAIARQIVDNLSTPDIIGLQEIQDNDGARDTTVTAADETLQLLVDEIQTASSGGVVYELVDNTFIGNNTSGGQPGANIRTAFLYNPARVELVDGSVRSIRVDGQQTDPSNPFFDSRLPLVAAFEHRVTGERFTVVNNHFSSKGGSSPLFGVNQPSVALQEDPLVNGSVDVRRAQAQAVKDFVDEILSDEPDANVIVLGDLNEFEFISPVLMLGESLLNLTERVKENERYTFIFDGNSQQLDHVLVSPNLREGAKIDIVHVNVEFAETRERASDHDPIVVRVKPRR